ncbi:lytic murein transglycosylase [Nocardioides aromaticivorans]|nr:lytic murein transglycosylase [Nocardioides aromaticivorans]
MSRMHRHRRSRTPFAPRRLGPQRVVAGLFWPAFAGTAASAVCVVCAAPAGAPRSVPDRAPATAVPASTARAVSGGPGYDAPFVVDGSPARGDRTMVLLWRAYAGAVEGAPTDCHLPLSLLAAIGQVESGSLSGRTLDAAHRVVPAVLGPVLDGHGYAAVADTDHGDLDGNSRWDRAVGPMQFLPGSWARHGRDGDGDGRLDPQDIEDAAATAAAYLCGDGRDLADRGQLAAALLEYGNARSYVHLVLSWQANIDAQLGSTLVVTPLPPVPVGFPLPAATPARTRHPATRNPAVRHAAHAVVHVLADASSPAAAPAHPADAPGDVPWDVEPTTENPVDAPGACPVPAAEPPTAEPGAVPAGQPAEEPAEEPAEGPVDEPGGEATPEPSSCLPAGEPVEEPAEEPAEEVTEEPADGPAGEPADDPVPGSAPDAS